ncbi:hypothetical protein ACWC10_17425 [Streptomyces sp. NPDC001595]|uniref:hypothetical protein n=1 Tax=Streptomyces sp. NPDC001532 TaxID=3154520 RepID=UPI0033333A1B
MNDHLQRAADQARADAQRIRDDYNRRFQAQYRSSRPARDVSPGAQVLHVALILGIAITLVILNLR